MVPVPTAVLWAMEFGEEGNEPVGRNNSGKPSNGKRLFASQYNRPRHSPGQKKHGYPTGNRAFSYSITDASVLFDVPQRDSILVLHKDAIPRDDGVGERRRIRHGNLRQLGVRFLIRLVNNQF